MNLYLNKIKIQFGLLIIFFLLSCSNNPEPIAYGKDSCDFCRMVIVDNKFGCEIFTKKGRTYKFDAIEFLVNYLRTKKNDTADIKSKTVTDYSNPIVTINAEKAFYLSSENIPSPMAANISAYQYDHVRNHYRDKNLGNAWSWEQVMQYTPL